MTKVIRKIRKFSGYSFSRKIEVMEYFYYLLVTQIIYKPRFISLGGSSIVKKNLFITPEYMSLGSNIFIGPQARIEGAGAWHNKLYNPILTIGDGVIFQQRCHVTFAGNLKIGANTFVAHDVTITDIDHDYKVINKPIAQQELIVNETEIGENCFIGSGVKIQAGTKLGFQCVVGANAVVRGEFPDYSVIVGVPAKVIKRFNNSTKCWERVTD